MDFNINIQEYIDKVLNNFDFAYTIAVNILTYVLIKFIDGINGTKQVSVLTKRIALICAIVIMIVSYITSGYTDYIVLINSSILAPVFWSWILRPICVKFNIGYKQIDKYLN